MFEHNLTQLEALESHAKLKHEVIQQLKGIIVALEANDYKEATKDMFLSPAGDGMGSEEYFIQFKYGDLAETTQVLIDLSETAGLPHTKHTLQGW